MRRALALLCAGAGALLLSPAARAATVRVVVEGIEPAPGRVYVVLCQEGLSGNACRIGQNAPATGPARAFLFEDVTPGLYAVAAYQDLNGNGRLDRTGLGLPLEPYGFSGEAGRRARPDFASTRFALREPGAALRILLARALPLR